jgi:hypothetical protein
MEEIARISATYQTMALASSRIYFALEQMVWPHRSGHTRISR